MKKQIALHLEENDIENLKIASAKLRIKQLALLEKIITEWLSTADLSVPFPISE